MAKKAMSVDAGDGTAVVVEELQISAIEVDEGDRLRLNEARLNELAESMKVAGQLNPIIVTTFGAVGKHPLRIVAGRRRLAAAVINGWKTILGIQRTYTSEEQLRRDLNVENIQREDLSEIEKGVAVTQLLDAEVKKSGMGGVEGTGVRDYGSASPPMRRHAVEAVAAMLGKPVREIRDLAFLTRLPERTRGLVMDRVLPLSFAREIAKLADPARQDELAKEYKLDDPTQAPHYGWDLGDLKREVSKVLYSLVQVPWRLDEAFAGKPACETCPNNSANTPGLFTNDKGKDAGKWNTDWKDRNGNYNDVPEPTVGICTSPACFQVKKEKARSAIASATDKTVRAIVADATEAGKKIPKKTRAVEIKDFLPAGLKPGSIVQQVTAKLERLDGKPKKKAESGPAYVDTYNSPGAKAGREFADAEREWANGQYNTIIRETRKSPAAWASLQLLALTEWANKLSSLGGERELKHLKSPTGVRHLACLASPGFEGIKHLAQDIKESYQSLEDLFSSPAATIAIAKALEIDLSKAGEAPRLETFYAKHGLDAKGKPIETAVKASAKTGKKAHTKAAKGKKPGAPAVDLDEDDEP